MSQPAENLRVRRTRRLLRDALVDLTEERGFERLTVGEITGRAMVSRAAFYRNYRDKYQLAEQIFDEAMAELLGTVTGEGDGRAPAERWVAFFEHIDVYHRFYGVLLGRRGSSWFADRMRASLTDMVKDHLRMPDGPGAVRDGLAATVLGAMFTQSITWWLESGRPCPPREIALRSAQLAGAVIPVANSWAETGNSAS
ncbi:TetR/AcrR family transcriptional regulator [Actinacidiphila acidipaludis]|uniref:TetR/AcrR family transcriptional regulator n=1 Tax=Actinacidiphila acidipaludis TaxID=2873382 RepID=A0ABS7QG31_9ACTN|nr:TetR/AcrR family transcriptional regulator [Streptomyces acidipaludis]MBY8882117.1 TetR/AcrR family transcriptional regulator [Streptomyces acidipaludis]